MITPVFRGRVSESGVLQVGPQFDSWLSTLKGQEVEVVVRKKRTQRSNQQNRYYWGVIIRLLSEFTGYTPEEMHEALKHKFLGTEEMDLHGLIRIRSTATLSVDEFIQYTNRVVQWAAISLLVYIPDPNMAEY